MRKEFSTGQKLTINPAWLFWVSGFDHRFDQPFRAPARRPDGSADLSLGQGPRPPTAGGLNSGCRAQPCGAGVTPAIAAGNRNDPSASHGNSTTRATASTFSSPYR